MVSQSQHKVSDSKKEKYTVGANSIQYIDEIGNVTHENRNLTERSALVMNVTRE